MRTELCSVLFNYLEFKIIKIYVVYKVVLAEAHFSVPLEFRYIFLQPYRPAQIKLNAYFVQRAKDLVGARIVAAVLYAGVLHQMIIPESSCP